MADQPHHRSSQQHARFACCSGLHTALSSSRKLRPPCISRIRPGTPPAATAAQQWQWAASQQQPGPAAPAAASQAGATQPEQHCHTQAQSAPRRIRATAKALRTTYGCLYQADDHQLPVGTAAKDPRSLQAAAAAASFAVVAAAKAAGCNIVAAGEDAAGLLA
jgi:hypothetical protein